MQLETQMNVPPTNDTPSARQGLLFVLAGPSGAGKDTVIQTLKERGSDFHVVASIATRAPRPGESEGNPYYFVSQAQFEHMVANHELLEYANVHGNWYGQPLQQVRENIQCGRDVLLKIDVQGAATVRKKLPGAILIFLQPGSVEELVERLINRQTETESERQRRLANAQIELAQRDHYDYVIENRQGKLDVAVDNLHAIMQAEHCRTHPHIIHI